MPSIRVALGPVLLDVDYSIGRSEDYPFAMPEDIRLVVQPDTGNGPDVTALLTMDGMRYRPPYSKTSTDVDAYLATLIESRPGWDDPVELD